MDVTPNAPAAGPEDATTTCRLGKDAPTNLGGCLDRPAVGEVPVDDRDVGTLRYG